MSDMLSRFFDELNFVIDNSHDISNITENISNEIGVGNGKLDHILFKLLGYNAFMNGDKPSLSDENSCRFGKWFLANKDKLKDDSKTINSLNSHHIAVHQKTKEATLLWEKGEFKKAIEKMQEVEHSSEVGFEELYDSFVKHRL